MDNPLDRLMGSLRSAFQSVITKRTPEGEVLKTAEDQQAYVDAQLEEMSAALADPTPEVKKEAPVITADAKPEEVLKNLPAPVLELIQKAQTDAAAALARAAAAETEVAKAREETGARMRIAKAETLLDGKLAGATKEELADILKALSPEQTLVLEKIFTSAKEQAKIAAVTVEIGKGGKAATDATAQLKAKTAEIRKEHRQLSESQAVAEVLKVHPELYEASLTKGE